MKSVAIVDASNVVRDGTGVNSGCRTPTLVHGLHALVQGLEKAGVIVELYGDVGLWESVAKQHDTVAVLSERFEDPESLRLWRSIYARRTKMTLGERADGFILRRTQQLIQNGYTPDKLRIVSNDTFCRGNDGARYLAQFEFLRDWCFHRGPNFRTGFSISDWRIRLDANPMCEVERYIYR